ncbi:MAG: hypothetical protein ACM3Y8_02190 [Byssovorax cruenta]|jgi:hypothetical protein
MTIYVWKFNTIPDSKDVEHFLDDLMPLFSRNANYLNGADGQRVVDLMRVEHNCGAVNLEIELNGVEGKSGDIFCFPGYYPGDLDEQGNPLFNICDTKGHYYGKIVATILNRAQRAFDMEMTSVKNEQQLYQTA